MSWDEKGRELLKGLFGDTNERRVKSLQPYLERTNSLEDEISKLTDDELKAKTFEFKLIIENALKDVPDLRILPEDTPKMPGQFRFQKDKILATVLDKMLPEAFAVCREVGKRTLNMRHFDVQILGGAALHFNKIAEMRTGEGKTLVATLPVYLNALAGRGVHIVTVNDYLARRDSEWMGTIYKFLGLDVGLIYSHQPDHEKYEAYRADISYGTNHEFGFDYLRDNMRTSIEDLAQRPYYYAIVDEVDNILIDEARTPLIISGAPSESYTEVYKRMAQIAPLLEKGIDKEDEDCDYWVDEKQKTALITERGVINAEKLLGVNDLFDMHFNFHHHLSQAVKAKELFKKDSEYVIRPNEEGKLEAVIVDEFTGRMMLGRRWSEGLHQAIEAKEGVPIQDETMTYASITYQNLFRLYPKLAGMTGTAMTEAPEFNKIYNLDVVAIPTNMPSIRIDNSDVIYKTERQKYYSVVEEIVDLHQMGRPVLVGTVSIEKSELISELLSKPQKINEYLVRKIAKAAEYIKKHNMGGHEIETLKKILERPGQIDAEKLEEAIQSVEKSLGKKHDELVERLYSIDATAKVVAAIRKGIAHNVLNAKHHEKEAHIVAQAGRKAAVTVATNMAGRGTDILLGGNAEFLSREQLEKEDLDPESSEFEEKLKELIKKYKKETDAEHEEVVGLGGLHIIGTERHESRRIDNQLRGRAGRQGDPGSARFFLSLEDSLMRIFGGEKIAGLMDLIGADEEMPIEAKMVSNSIQNAQKKVEAHHFDLRKHVLQYDDVLNTQREVIYRERRKILENEDLKENVHDMMEEHIDLVMQAYIDPEDPPELWAEKGLPEVLAFLENDVPFLNELNVDELAGYAFEDVKAKIFEEMKLAHEARETELGVETLRDLERQVLLRTIDTKWVDYLHNIDLLRDGVNLRGYGQRDPLQEYKREAFDMFNMLLRSIQQESIQYIFHAQPMVRESEGLPDDLPPELADALAMHGIILNEDGEIDPEDLERLLSEVSQEDEDDDSDNQNDHDAPESKDPSAAGKKLKLVD
ncbi:MAG: preprotein translocase subunit SecA, partial [Candidatus Obscuribacterales bacterium]|nr:preprotein translocase subunit SecA [Candidatus Obscuribacterales bacterium]